MREDEVDDGGTQEEQRFNYIHCQIEWRVKLNNRVVAKDTEQDLALPPSSYWERIEDTARDVLRRKIAHNRRVRLDDTNVVVSVNERSQSDLIKRFEGTNVDWTTMTRADFSSSDKRGKTSVTKGMVMERDAEMDAEQASGGHEVWRDVYRIMRCPGPPCRHEGQYCGQDPHGKKHYRLRTNHLKMLTRYVQQGGVIETHDDIPDNVREQLYAEENQRLERRKKSSDSSTCGSTCHPVHFHLPSQMPIPTTTVTAETVKKYATWHQSRVSSETFRENIQKVRDVALENCLDLKQIHDDQDPEFFVENGVKAGAARRLVSYIVRWVTRNMDPDGIEE
ncbi:hypothetical protein N7513_007238 [Penicillium frequentans]|nr:hypothetical protein N7513_007238 [Penicillium glabrum]